LYFLYHLGLIVAKFAGHRGKIAENPQKIVAYQKALYFRKRFYTLQLAISDKRPIIKF
jgi:hypothetical protein